MQGTDKFETAKCYFLHLGRDRLKQNKPKKNDVEEGLKKETVTGCQRSRIVRPFWLARDETHVP